MKGERYLRFRNARPLLISGGLEQVLAEIESTGTATSLVDRLQKEGIAEVFILIDARGDEGKYLKVLDRFLKDMGIVPSYLSYKPIQANRFSYYERVNSYIRGRLRSGSCLLLFPSRDEPVVLSYLPTLLLSRTRVDIGASELEEAFSGAAALHDRTRVQGFADYLRAQRKSDVSARPFTPSRFSIRAKLLTIISSIVAVSLLASIVVATFLFQKSSEILIQDYNLSVARMTGGRVELQLQEIAYRAQTFQAGAVGAEIFFRKNESILHLSILERRGNILRVVTSETNLALLQRLQTTAPIDFRAQAIANTPDYDNAFKGTTVVRNVAPSLKIPTMMIAFPLENRTETIAVVYFLSSELTSSFQRDRQADFFQLVVVDPEGRLLAHSDESVVLNGTSVTDMPLVQTLMQSPGDNGSQKYSYHDVDFLGSYYILRGTGIGVVSAVPSDRAFEAVFKIQRQNIWTMVIVLTVTFAIVFLFARTITVPIVNLVRATHQIERGRYDLDIQPETRDEIGMLTNSFLSMAKGLRERETIKEAFGKFVNPEIAERALRGELRLGGVKKTITVLFADLRDFTAMSENLSSEQVVGILNDYFTEMVECISLTGGIVDKFIGDAIMAHWGAIMDDPEAARKSVHSALLMRRALVELNVKFAAAGRPKLRFGCGINIGPAVAGQIGSEKRLEYTVIGDAVNLASRIEYLNKHFGTDILISDDVATAVKDQFILEQLPALQIRGKAGPQIVYVVLGWKDDPGTPRDLPALRDLLGVQYDEKMVLESLAGSQDSFASDSENEKPK